MRLVAIIILAAITTVASATSWYISPSGNDSNNGSISSPFFTLNKAWSVSKAGDVIYVRGGVYRFNSRQNLAGKSGTSSDTIKIWAYPGERPVFTKSSDFVTPSWPVALIYVKANYIHIRGIEVSYFTQKTSTIWYGIAVLGSNNNKFERINSHHNGHGMVIRDESNKNLVLNCDFHDNYDPLTSGDAYGNADGLEVGYQSASMENTISGCRLWRNSDDGIDLWQNNGNVTIDRCWSWQNGYREDGRTTGGDGGGFKFGGTTTQTGTSFKRTIKNSISFYNRTRGFNQNGAYVKFYCYNNIAWKNPYGFVFPSYNLQNVFRNNIVFDNTTSNWNGSYSNAIKDHNSYDASLPSSGPVASSADFMSLDTTGISKARKSNGALPDINFMKLVPGSDLIDAGINVGTAYAGKAPDLGVFETLLSASMLPSQATTLSYENSTVKSATPSEVEVTYNLPIASDPVPSVTSFEVKVNSVSRSISQINISDRNVRLTLSAPVQKGDEVLLSYLKPSVNPLQGVDGIEADSLIAKLVSNLVETIASDTTVGLIAVLPYTAKDFISIQNFDPGESTAFLRFFDFSGKLCQETVLDDPSLMKNIPLSLPPGFYKVQIVAGAAVVYNQKMLVLN